METDLTALLCTACFTLQALQGFCQATILFENNELSLLKQRNGQYSPDTHKLFGYVQLAYAPVGTPMKDTIITYDPQEYEDWLSNNPGWSFTSTATVWNGLFSGGTITLNGISEGAAIRYALFAWGPYPTIRQNYEDWSGGSWGFAGPFSTQTGGGGAPPVSLANSLPEIVLPAPGPIPEPSVTALVVLGLGVVYKFRHRDEPPFGAAGDDESETFLADRSTSLI